VRKKEESLIEGYDSEKPSSLPLKKENRSDSRIIDINSGQS